MQHDGADGGDGKPDRSVQAIAACKRSAQRHQERRREGLTPNGRDDKDGTGRSPKARRRIAPTRVAHTPIKSMARQHALIGDSNRLQP